MQRILRVCGDCGLLWHKERVTFKNGATEFHRVDDIEPEGSVLVTAQYEKYGLRANPRLLPRLKTMGPQFAYALNVATTSVEVDGDIVYVRVPRAPGVADSVLTYDRAWAIDPHIPRGNLLLGVDEDQRQLLLELTAPTNVHAAVIGMTGSGKSTLLRTMVLSAQMIGGAQVALFDPSGGLFPLSGHPSVWRGGLFRSAEECELGLATLANSLGRRANTLLYAFVDEVPDLIAQRPAIREHLGRLAQAGRHSGVHLILGAQHLVASQVGPMTLRNIPVRLVGRVTDRTAAYSASGRNDIAAEKLRGNGDFIAVSSGAQRHFQAALIPEATVADWARRYPPRPPRLPVRADDARHSSVTSDLGTLVRVGHAGGGRGGTGRRPDEIPAAVLREIRDYVGATGREPSCNWVYNLTHATLPTGGYNRDKARRAIALALERQPVQHTKRSLEAR
jgi:energy-coupling factor transporter ATP-binding protein EcfA2